MLPPASSRSRALSTLLLFGIPQMSSPASSSPQRPRACPSGQPARRLARSEALAGRAVHRPGNRRADYDALPLEVVVVSRKLRPEARPDGTALRRQEFVEVSQPRVRRPVVDGVEKPVIAPPLGGEATVRPSRPR